MEQLLNDFVKASANLQAAYDNFMELQNSKSKDKESIAVAYDNFQEFYKQYENVANKIEKQIKAGE